MNRKILVKKEIKRWWENNRNLRWDNIYKNRDYTSYSLNERMNKILNFLDFLSLKKANILEIGFGGGQLAFEILKRNHNYTGFELSNNFIQIAKKRCRKFSKKKPRFLKGSIEDSLNFKSLTFDIVVVSGVLQYSTNPQMVFNEINRVLKKDCFFICSQTNFHKFYYFFNLRAILVRLYFLFSNEKYEVTNSIKSLITETKLKKFSKTKFITFLNKTNFYNKGYIKMNYKFKKRIFTLGKLKNFCEKSSFKIIKQDASSPYLKTGNDFGFTYFFSKVIENLSKIYFFGFLKYFGESVIVLSKKN